MNLKDIIKTKKQIEEMGYNIENNYIEEVDINTIAHFGNATCFVVMCSNVCATIDYNNIRNLGYIIRAFIEFFELYKEDGLRLTEIKNIPCRLIFEGGWGSRCIGFGHFIKNKFILIEDFAKLDE